MANPEQILNGFFGTIRIRIISASIVGGRKTVKKEFPNRDTQTIEDLGLRPRTYTLEIILAPLTFVVTDVNISYFEYRDALLAEFERKRPTILIHPLYGTINNVVVTDYTVSENFSDFGLGRVTATFEVNDGTGIPTGFITALSQQTTANSVVTAAVNTNVKEAFNVFTKFTANFTDAVTKINEIIDAAKDSTAFLGATADKINEFNNFLGQLSADVNGLVTSPVALADAITNIFSNVDGLFGTVENTAKAFAGFFDFGGNDESDISPTTVGRIQRKQNRAVLNGAVNVSALGFAYINVSQTQFDNVREIEAAADDLEIQFQRVVTAGISNEALAAITEMRVVVQKFFDEKKVTLKQIITVNVFTTPVRVLSYQYYAESKTADQIIKLNDISDVSFVDGDVEIVTA